MTADFSTKKVDLSKVSNAVKKVVSDIAKTEGSKKKIDSEREYGMLSQYLSGNAFAMTNDEIGYIEGFMIDYQKTKYKEFEKDSVTDNTKKEVSKIAKRMGDKKTIDTDEEAQALALLLNDTHNDLNLADKNYIVNLLITNGYANYLPKPEGQPVTIVNILLPENEQQNENQVNAGAEDKNCTQTECKPVKVVKKQVKPNKAKKEADRAAKEADRSKAEADRSAKEADRSKAEADRSAKEADRSAKEADRSKAEADRAKKEADKAEKIANAPKVKEAGRAKGFGIASKIQEELHDIWTSNSVIKEELSRLDNTSAYSFVGKMMEISDKHNVFGAFFDRITAKDAAHVIRALLGQAKNIGLEKDPAYKELVNTYLFLKRQYVEKTPEDPIYDTKDIEQLDAHVKNLYNTMSKVYK